MWSADQLSECRQERPGVANRSRLLDTCHSDRGVNPERIAVLPIWTTIPETPMPPARTDWRASQGIGSDTFVVLYAGTIGMLNDAEVLVEAVERLADRRQLLLLFVGDGATLDRVKRRAGRGIGNVRFAPLQPQAMMAEIYAARFSDPDGRIRVTFDVLWLSGWAPHASQQKPLQPGSAQASLAEAVKRSQK